MRVRYRIEAGDQVGYAKCVYSENGGQTLNLALSFDQIDIKDGRPNAYKTTKDCVIPYIKPSGVTPTSMKFIISGLNTTAHATYTITAHGYIRVI